TEDDYWIELPLLPVNLTPLTLGIIRCIEENPGIQLEDLNSRMQQEYWKELEGKRLYDDFLVNLWKQGLVESSNNIYNIGSRWEPIKPYAEVLGEMRQEPQTLEQLSDCDQTPWIVRQSLHLEP
ncbi:MAG: hypothetical protein VKJ24_09425, partial [Synechococcales bacterium]|nr:hypothetical protein [Synechococcales bacterium]